MEPAFESGIAVTAGFNRPRYNLDRPVSPGAMGPVLQGTFRKTKLEEDVGKLRWWKILLGKLLTMIEDLDLFRPRVLTGHEHLLYFFEGFFNLLCTFDNYLFGLHLDRLLR